MGGRVEGVEEERGRVALFPNPQVAELVIPQMEEGRELPEIQTRTEE